MLPWDGVEWVDTHDGVIAKTIEPKSAADRAWLLPGDRLIGINFDGRSKPDELRRARDYIFGQLDLNLENTENQMTWLGEQYLGYGKIISPEEVKSRIAEVTPREIRSVARDFFSPDRLNLAVVSPLKKINGLEPILANITV